MLGSVVSVLTGQEGDKATDRQAGMREAEGNP